MSSCLADGGRVLGAYTDRVSWEYWSRADLKDHS